MSPRERLLIAGDEEHGGVALLYARAKVGQILSRKVKGAA